MRGARFAIAGLIVAAAGCSSATREAGTYHAVESGVLYRGAAPTHDSLKDLQEQGIRTVVDLRYEDPGDEPQQVAALGMQYVSIPSSANHPSDEKMARALAIMMCAQCQPVFVHCQLGKDRTGMAVAVYRITADGWDAPRAIDELQSYRDPVRQLWYRQVARYVNHLNAAALLEQIRASGCPVCTSQNSREIQYGEQTSGR